MALQKTIELDNGLTATDAYIKIRHLHGCKGNINASVEAYASKAIADAVISESRNDLWLKVWNFQIPAVDVTANLWQQTYVYLKTLDEFEECTDC